MRTSNNSSIDSGNTAQLPLIEKQNEELIEIFANAIPPHSTDVPNLPSTTPPTNQPEEETTHRGLTFNACLACHGPLIFPRSSRDPS